MNKSILTIVLASLALPAMALTIDQQAKLDNAWSVLTANGVNPTVMKNNINVSFDTANTQAVYDSNVTNFGQSFLNSDSIARKGKENFFTVNGGKVTSGNSFIQIKGNNGYFKFIKEGLTFSSNKASSTSAHTFSTHANTAYDYLTSNNTGIGVGAALGINRLDSKIRDSDIGGEVGSAIQNNALRFKDTIGNLMRLEAAVELGKQVYPTCVEDSSSIACTNLGFEMEELGEQIIFINPREHYIHDGQRWFINGTKATNEITGVTENKSYLIGWNALYVSDVVTLDDYENSLVDIIDIADAFILINDSDATFGNLTNL